MNRSVRRMMVAVAGVTCLAGLSASPAAGKGDVNGDNRADLVIVGTGPTASGKLETHVLNGASNYSTFLSHAATAAGYANANDRLVMGDVNGDNRADLVIVGTGPTASGKLETHVLNGATNYSTFLSHSATAAGYANASDRLVMGDVNGDNRADLVIVGTGPTASGKLETHVLNGANSFTTFLSHAATAAGYASSNDTLVMGDVNADNRADLVIVGRGPTASGKLEAHVLNGANNYSTFLSHAATAAGYANVNDSLVMGDVNGDNRADLAIVGRGPTASGKLEAHVLNSANNFSTFLFHAATAAGYANSGDVIVMGG